VRKRRFDPIPYLFILPHLIFFATFLAWPFFYGIYISLFDFDFLRPESRPFVGAQNYLNLFTRGSIQFTDFWRAMFNTGAFIVWSVPPLVGLALLLAVLLNGKYPGRNLFRGIYFAPYALSVTVAALLWWWIFQPQGGMMNQFLGVIGLGGRPWLSEMPWAWIAITVATVWWTIGFNTVIFLAALQEIPESLYEAASIDGANPIQQFFAITIPSLRPVLVFVITITLLASANLFGQPYLMTQGGPLQKTESIMMRIYSEGILQNRMGSAAAMSVFVAALLLILTTVNFRIFGRGDDQ
jgi:multiple sugar transport system permease protein